MSTTTKQFGHHNTENRLIDAIEAAQSTEVLTLASIDRECLERGTRYSTSAIKNTVRELGYPLDGKVLTKCPSCGANNVSIG